MDKGQLAWKTIIVPSLKGLVRPLWYEKHLKQWSRLTSLDKKLQAELVVYKLENHESKIKEKITTQIGDQLEGKEDGIERDRIPYLRS